MLRLSRSHPRARDRPSAPAKGEVASLPSLAPATLVHPCTSPSAAPRQAPPKKTEVTTQMPYILPISYKELEENGIVHGPIQSIQQIKKEKLTWILERIKK